MNMKELEETTGVPSRQIRYLISLDLVPRPAGEKRWAEYGDEHVDAIRRWQSLDADGLNAASMAKAFKAAPISILVAEGVTLLLDPKIVPERFDQNRFAKAIAKVLPRHLDIRKETADEND